MKGYLRFTEDRLDSLMFLNVHQDKTDGLTIHDVTISIQRQQKQHFWKILNYVDEPIQVHSLD